MKIDKVKLSDVGFLFNVLYKCMPKTLLFISYMMLAVLIPMNITVKLGSYT